MFILQQNYHSFLCIFLVKKKKGKIQNNPVIVSYFALCFTARPRHFSEILNACVSALLFYLTLITFGSIRFGHYSVIYLMGRRYTLRPEHSFLSIPFPFHYITIHSVLLPIPKLLPLSFQRKHVFHRLTMPLCRAFRQ